MSKDSDKFVLQTRLFATMRRVLTRVIDIEYLRTDRAYADMILQLAEDSGDEELIVTANKLRQLMGVPKAAILEVPRVEASEPPAPTRRPEPPASQPAARYVGSLR